MLCGNYLVFRVVLSVLTTLITEHILKVQNVEYKTRCLEMLVDRALKLRHAAAVATKLCLSALSDGHTIDVFWVLFFYSSALLCIRRHNRGTA